MLSVAFCPLDNSHTGDSELVIVEGANFGFQLEPTVTENLPPWSPPDLPPYHGDQIPLAPAPDYFPFCPSTSRMRSRMGALSLTLCYGTVPTLNQCERFRFHYCIHSAQRQYILIIPRPFTSLVACAESFILNVAYRVCTLVIAGLRQ